MSNIAILELVNTPYVPFWYWLINFRQKWETFAHVSLFIDVSHRITFSLAWWLLRPPPNPSMKSPPWFRFFEFFLYWFEVRELNSVDYNQKFCFNDEIWDYIWLCPSLLFSLLLYRFGSILLFVCLCPVSKPRCNWKSRFGLSFFSRFLLREKRNVRIT